MIGKNSTLLALAIMALSFLCRGAGTDGERLHPPVCGVTLVAPAQPLGLEDVATVRQTGANWIAIIPFAFSRPQRPEVVYPIPGQWWGETEQGIRRTAQMAHQLGFRVLLKPHVWISHRHWSGSFALSREEDWQRWEAQYQAYILQMARLAREEGMEMFCVGNELSRVVRERPQFWPELIAAVRQVYPGPVTYAANWDNFQQVSFWQALDYIGINAYFPLVQAVTPTVEQLVEAWRKGPLPNIAQLARKWQKPVLFTEFGYPSEDYAAWRHWERGDGHPNLQAQANAYQAFFQVFWEEPWVAGGFLWKWYAHRPAAGGSKHRGFTPQNKPALQVIQHWYRRSTSP